MKSISDKVHSTFRSALLEGNRNASSRILSDLLKDGFTAKDVYEQVIKTALYEIGELWEYNKISVASEHLASAIVESLLNEIFPLLSSKQRKQKRILVASVENEFHQIGIKMVADIFESNGWDSFFLGANTPTSDLIRFAQTIHPDIIALSLSIYFHIPTLEIMIQKIRQVFPEIPILVGGQAFNRGAEECIANYSNVIYLKDLYSVETYLKTSE
jgi:MerR family transcriptional regulator, light-induced transcriptional regulator